jgi:hypothetical protein
LRKALNWSENFFFSGFTDMCKWYGVGVDFQCVEIFEWKCLRHERYLPCFKTACFPKGCLNA